MVNKKFWAATFTLTGTIIGAGILGLPYVFAKSGFLTGVFWIIIIAALMIFVNLCLGEITLRTKGKHQLSGYAEKYLGKWGKRIMFFAMVFGIYSALLAYIVGEGDSISKIVPGGYPPIIFGIMFWLLMTTLLREGLKGLKKIETWGVSVIVIIISIIFIKFMPTIQSKNLLTFNPSQFITPIGVIIFAFLGFTSIPELREEIKGQEAKLKKAIIIGCLIPAFLYILFSAAIVGILGANVNQVATLSLGSFITLLGTLTMFTSYLVLSFSLKDAFKYDLKSSDKTIFFFVSLVPLIIYIIITHFQLLSFTYILGIGGVISGGLTGIMILIITKKAKEKTKRKIPKIQMPLNWISITIISLLFIMGIILECFL